MDSWPTVGECISHRLHNYTQHVVKDGIDLDTKNPSPHFEPPNLLDNRQALFHLLPRADRTQMAQMASKNRLWWPKWCVLKLIYSCPMSGLLMVIFLHVPSKTTHMLLCILSFHHGSNHPIIQIYQLMRADWITLVAPTSKSLQVWALESCRPLHQAPKHRLFLLIVYMYSCKFFHISPTWNVKFNDYII